MKALPSPSGRYLAGSACREIVDPDRAAHVATQDRGRRLFVKAWYPAGPEAAGTCRRERLWEQVRDDAGTPSIVKLVLRPAMKVLTNTYRDAPYAADAGPPRVLIYNHGLISFASENSTLMEHLASRGYVVLSLQHRDQLAELKALQRTLGGNEKREQASLQRAIKSAATEERAALWKQYFRLASNTNRIVEARSLDVEHVVAELAPLLGMIPGVSRAAEAELIGILGLSIGGAVAIEYAKRNRDRTRRVVNMDGGIYGALPDESVEAYCLMLCSEENRGLNDLALSAANGGTITNVVIPGTKHLNFHDIAAVFPKLKWLGALGSADPAAVIHERNRLVLDFLSQGARDEEAAPAARDERSAPPGVP